MNPDDDPVTVTVFDPVAAVPAPTRRVRAHVPFAGGMHDEPEGYEHVKPNDAHVSERDTF